MSSLHRRVLTALVSGILVVIIAAGGLALAHVSSSAVSAQRATIFVRGRSRNVSNNTRTALDVSCGPGEVATGGGGNIGFASTRNAYIATSAPLPSRDGAENPTGWTVTVGNQSGAVQSATVWVLCEGG